MIELLVVIAIIAILAAILFPVFARARENARRSSCQSNLKQINLGLIQYRQDYDEKFVPQNVFNSGPFSASRTYGWADTIQPYLKSTQIYQCPSESGGPYDIVNHPEPSTTGLAYTDYGYNVRLSTPSGSNNPAPVSEAVVENPVLSIVIFEDFAGNARRGSSGAQSASTPITACSGTNCLANLRGATGTNAGGGGLYRHLEGSNFAFIDGHVKWYKSVGGDTGSTGVSDVIAANIYGRGVPFSLSGNNPTFHYNDNYVN